MNDDPAALELRSFNHQVCSSALSVGNEGPDRFASTLSARHSSGAWPSLRLV